MLKFTVFLSLLYLVCSERPTPQKPDRPKQFRYVEEEEPVRRHHYPSAQRQVDNPHHQYGYPTNPEAEQYSPPHKAEAQREYGVEDRNEDQSRPLVSVNTQNTELGKNVGVGVNVGRIYQMDLNQENNFGSKAVNLGLSVLNGLVKVNVNRERDPFSGKRGPILVQVGGHTVYSNGGY